MDVIERLIQHYLNQAPLLSFTAQEGDSLKVRQYHEWPEKEAGEELGAPVWRGHEKASSNTPPPDGYCVIDACLDASGFKNPGTLPLHPQMRGQEIRIIVYVDTLNCIHMRAIGGYSINT